MKTRDFPLWFWMLGAVSAALGLSSCAPMPIEKLSADVFYKRDMQLNIDGYPGEGTLVVPRAAKHHFDVTARGRLDLFTLESCHRETETENAGDAADGGFLGMGKHARVVMDYTPSNPLETSGSCIVRIGGYEQNKGRHSWALIDFEDPDTTLPAEIRCNGDHYLSHGVTVCQSKEGLIQQIVFTAEVHVTPSVACPMDTPADNKTFTFKMPPKECVYNFLEITAGKRRQHRLTTLGYQSILIRGGT